MAQERAQRRGPATLRDVAGLAGVHPATASRALNPTTRELVNAETAQRVLSAAERLGYRPNPIARSLKTNRSLTVGVIVPDLMNPLFPPIARGVEQRLEPAGYTSLLANTDNDPDRERHSIEALVARQVDGFITASARRDDALLRELHAAGVPLVLVNRRMDDDAIPSVVADDAAGIHRTVEHLLELGHRRIAHLGGPHDVSTGIHRHEAFLAAMRGAGVEVDEGLIAEGRAFTEREGARLCKELLAAHPDVTAIVAGNDLMALGCIDALREAGLRCPADVSVVGFNDMDWCDRFDPALTTVHVPHYELGVEAAGLLLEVLADASTEARHVLLPVELVRRASTAPPVRAAVGG